MLGLFSITALTSALLIFWVEPLFAKLVLPLLGGSPAVWNTCLMYFQAMLLLGYLYAHITSKYFNARKQAWIHVVLLCLALITLPIGIPRDWTPPASGQVIGWLIGLLTIGVGAPFLLLAATAPMLQRWISESDHPAAENPYLLYAASNAGSLLGLVAFPIILEPNLLLSQQSRLWSWGFALAIALTAGCGLTIRAGAVRADSSLPADDSPTMGDRIRWIALAFAPSSLLLGVTTYLSTDVAAVPLLWVIPLALYLITFIVVFARKSRTPSTVTAVAHALLVTILVLVNVWNADFGFKWEYALNLGVFTTTALVLHGELAVTRPSPRYLTEFYLMMALGGALGGAFNALVAPLIFKSIAEYQLVVVLACFLRPGARYTVPNLRDAHRHVVPITTALIPMIILGLAQAMRLSNKSVLGISVELVLSLVVGAIAVALSSQPLRFGIAIAGIAVIGWISQRPDYILHRDRSFYGAYEVQQTTGRAHFLVHGTTIHGAQYTDSARHLLPTTYYHPDGPAGQLFRSFQDSIPHKRIGVVGLGAGTLLCYSKPGEEWTFFEIDPVVERIARNPKYFTYLRDCPVRPKIVFGDARLTLAREPSKKFGLLIIDAFSSDAIPVHMLTRQAFALYRRVLDDEGILLVHISNQHLDLKPVVAKLADDAGLTALIGEHVASSSDESSKLDYSSDWVGLTRRPDKLRSLAKDHDWHPLVARTGDRPWTDDYSNVFSVIRW